MSIKEAKLLKKLWCCVCVCGGGGVCGAASVWGGGLGILQDNLVSSTEIIT